MKVKKATLAAVAACLMSIFSIFASYQNQMEISKVTVIKSPHIEGVSTEESVESVSGCILLSQKEGKLVCDSPRVPLQLDEPVVVKFPEGEYTLEYDMNAGYLKATTAQGEITFTPNTDELSSMHTFSDDEGNTIAAGGVEDLFITVKPASEEMMNLLENIEILPYNGQMNLAVEKLPINQAGDVVITDELVSNSHLNISVYNKSLEGTSFQNEITVAEWKFLYGDYVDTESGLRPYIFKSDSCALKIMASGEEALNSGISASLEESLCV